MNHTPYTKTKTCARCQSLFGCGSEGNGCWCDELPPLVQLDSSRDCYCPECLKIEIKQKIARLIAAKGHEKAFREKVKETKKTGVLIEGIDYYFNEQGNWVFTSWYHLKRGSCCQNGCRHCPYGFKKQQA